MKESLEKQIEIVKTPIGETVTGHSYNLKEQLDQLIGPTDFKYKLEKVNLTIGIIVSSMLLFFFFL